MTDTKKEVKQDPTVALLRANFEDNKPLLLAIRSLFLGFEVTPEERASINSAFSNDELKKLVWKRFYPTFEKEDTLGGSKDVWMGMEEVINGAHPDTIKQAVESKALSLEMTHKALSLIDNPEGERVDISYIPELHKDDTMQVFLHARNQFIKHVDMQLMMFWIQANQDSPEAKNIEEAMRLNSAK